MVGKTLISRTGPSGSYRLEKGYIKQTTAKQHAIGFPLRDWLLNALAAIVLLSILYELGRTNASLLKEMGWNVADQLKLKTFGLDALIAVLTALLSLKYAIKQLELSYSPFLTYSNRPEPSVYLRNKETALVTRINNVGTGAAVDLIVNYRVEWADASAPSGWMDRFSLEQELAARRLKSEVDYWLPGFGAGGAFAPGRSELVMEAAISLLERVNLIEMVWQFRGQFGGKFRKTSMLIPPFAQWSTLGVSLLESAVLLRQNASATE
jgi:hypothetical protein